MASNKKPNGEKYAEDESSDELDNFYDNFQITSETTCGYGFCGGSLLQR